MGQCSENPSPVLINLSNSSANYHLTAASDGVVFDIDADGTPDPVAWTEADSEIAFLAFDRNQNGRIDDGAELFGNAAPLTSGQRARHGFEALLDLDGDSDGRIDSSDPVYAYLHVWVDRNHNGISEPQELQTLQRAGITTILTAYRESRRTDTNGNVYRYVGKALVVQNHQDVPRHVFDVFLRVAR